ncbi:MULTISPECIES: multidrug efflux RND transporter permease subunit SdeB [unclassified Serratia (in: enterobacteria)]|uniref:multidrug efflux RND transporter permease subunit SdeB n=1 Tax=unclassified Serratia (in: enterobacteria) TaxID=2647522 RepID=UPI000CDC0B4A|nr:MULTISPECIES: multidrug efflux RND transporter permease subunit SdeB [unclassified Serratia (in: enterobacteria)]AUY14538.1 multidrug efflux RND transporter permease subunit [Serratia sp. SSNIH1]POU52377.1 multidrug efflux RND transporter permease subunit [Serratia sp. SSNIH4]POW36283.1 multidrug efflux RND transporter permease subunit [Serratia sp. SSNIH2]POW37240.1 multidrug efflux RND transporter permease subunit [Serratia sp. SSNIH5]POW57777.1 multidrug efflux RND transporter permease s
MDFSRFFIDRPIFAAVLSILIFVAGAIAIPLLPISEYPDVVPPSVQVRAEYPGANPKEIAETVATPLEEAINGVENMMYMKSVAGSDGVLVTTVTFRPGTDPDQAQVQVQNRVAQAEARLPEDVRRQGITTQKQSPALTLVVHLVSPSGKYDSLYLRNYATLKVKDELARLPGVGQVQIFGAGEYAMRIWLDPNKVAARGLTASDVVSAMQEQNVQVSAGQLGAEPMPTRSDYLLSINAQGRLQTEEEFGNIILKSGDNGEIVRLRDVARIEMGSGSYALRAQLNNKDAVGIGIFQSPGANAIELSDAVRGKMAELATRFPDGMSWKSPYDPTVFVRDSIRAVVDTLLEAVILVVLVVILFLQTWRASIIPLLAVPISVVGTFAVLYMLGFSLNTLSLFGLVLAIGIVVDDAIVVVENVERNIEEGLSPLAAAHQAMREVSGPIIAIAVVLCAVFVPMAFLSGVTGQFYKQFAVTIAISTVISAINSLTLSPALAARLLKPHGAPKDLPSRLIDRLFGWLFRPFNRFFASGSQRYQRGVSRVLGRRGAVFVVYLLLLAAAGVMFKTVPGGFIPTQDKLYLIGGVKMPEGASLERTDAVIRKMSAIGLSVDGVTDAVAFPGLNALQFTNTPNTGTVFFALESLSTRTRTAAQINAEINARISQIQEGFAFSIMPPPILGIGQGSGYSLYVQDRAGPGYGALQTAINTLSGAIMQTPGMGFPISSYQANVPQLDAKIDRDKAKAQGVPLNALFSTLQTYLGSSYINDFNRYGRTWKVMAQADGQFRDSVEDIANLRTRNDKGEMVPIGSMVSIGTTYGPDPVIHYNGFPAADLIGDADPRVLSSTQAMGALTQMAGKLLPNGMNIQWTDLSYQQSTQGNAALVVFPVAVLLAFLALAALYESWTLPLAVILIVPMTMLSALFGVWLTGGDNNVFVQVGLVVLMGLACKNAILIVEFARELEMQGKGIVEAALEACRLRLRPIVMTSIAFIAGTIPLILGHGAGAEVRGVTGITVFSGMLGVTLFGLFLTPVFYVTLRRLVARKAQPQTA